RAELEIKVEEARQKRAADAAKLDQDVLKKRQEAEEEKDKARKKAAEAEQLRQAMKEKQDAANQAKRKAREARVEAEKLKQDAEGLLPDRRIAAFIQDRAGAKDYRRHLGLPALIRRDFEKLSAMFRTQRQYEGEDKDGKDKDGNILN